MIILVSLLFDSLFNPAQSTPAADLSNVARCRVHHARAASVRQSTLARRWDLCFSTPLEAQKLRAQYVVMTSLVRPLGIFRSM